MYVLCSAVGNVGDASFLRAAASIAAVCNVQGHGDFLSACNQEFLMAANERVCTDTAPFESSETPSPL